MHQNIPRRGARSLRYQQLEARCVLDASALRITELLASNDIGLEDYQGDAPDWVEIYNPSGSTVDLSGLYLTDNDQNLTKWQFPAGVSIEPNDFLVVFASDKDLVAPNGELHTNFKLSADGEYFGLIGADGQTVIDAFAPEFPAQVEDVSYGLSMSSSTTTLVADGAAARAWRPTSAVYDSVWTAPTFDDSVFNIVGPSGFGFEEAGGFPNFNGHFNTEVDSGTTTLYVRIPFEMTSLAGIDQMQLRLKYDDGFVAYLNGVQVAAANAPATPNWNSTATSIHDDFDAIEFQEFDILAATPSLVLGENVLAIHALNRSADSSDFLIVPELVVTQSTIDAPESIGYFDEPTPGFGNGEPFAGFAEDPTFSVPHGFYTSSQQVEIESDTPGALIVYTTDGSTPAVNENFAPINGQEYTGPIAVSSTTTIRAIAFKQDFKPSFVQTASYMYLDDVVNQSPAGQAPAGWPNFNVNGQLLDYGIDPEIVALYGEQAVKDSLTSIPTIALTTDVENLFDATTGIYVNALNRGSEWERAASVELIYPDQTEGFSTNAGLRIRGGYHRNDFNPKHAFRLYFRGEYGDGMLDYPLFGEEGAERFDVLDLRTAQNYSWAAWGNSVNGLQNSYLREVFSRDTQADMDQPYTRSNYYHLYLNGQYWGLYMTQERIQEDFAESYFGGDPEDYDVVKADSTEAYTTEIADGNDIAWRQLYDMAQELADNPTSEADNYWAMQGLNPDGTRNENLEVLLDVDNLIDYMMIIIYTGGHDTGISAFVGNDRANNWFGLRNREDGELGFQFFLHDNEHSLGAGEINGTLHGTLDIDRTGPFFTNLDDNYDFFNPVYLHQDLLVHPEYQQQFIDRVQTLMFNDGLLTSEANIARMLERKNQVESAIIAESARWGDAKRSQPYNKADWDAEAAWLLDTYFNVRGDIVIDQLQNDGLYNEYGGPQFSQLGGDVPYGFPLQLTTPQGTIYYSLDGETDPRQIGGGVTPSGEVHAYSSPIVLTEFTTVWARTLEPSGQWSGLVKATFSAEQLTGDFNTDGFVNQIDYLVWRETYGSTTDLRADGNNDQVVDAADYTIWRDNLGYFLSVATPATATPSTVTGTTADLSVLGSSSSGEENLNYTWTVTGPSEVSFTSNGDNASKDTTASFTKAGDYQFAVIIENTVNNRATISIVEVSVEQVGSGISIEPANSIVAAGAALQLTAFEVDQFGDFIDTPSNPTWSILSGGGSVDASGVYTSLPTSGTATVRVETTAGDAESTITIVAPTTWYEANSNSGSTLIDSSSGGNSGAIVGSSSWTSGIDGNALSLTGGHVELPNGIVSGLNDMTIATWFYLDSVSTWSRVFDFGTGTNVNMFLTPEAVGANGPLRFAITTAGGGEQQINGPDLSPGQWYHVAITLDGNSGAMYVNGSVAGTNANLSLNPSDMGITTNNYIGDSQYGSDPPLYGRIDDFRIYSAALPPEQILQLSQSSAASYASDQVSAVLLSSNSIGQPADYFDAATKAGTNDNVSTEALQIAFSLLAEPQGKERKVTSKASAAESVVSDDLLLLNLVEPENRLPHATDVDSWTSTDQALNDTGENLQTDLDGSFEELGAEQVL